MANSSFLPEDYVEKRAERRSNLLILFLFLVVVGVGAVAFYFNEREYQAVRAAQADVNHKYEEAAKRLEQLDELQARKEQMLQKARVTAVLLERVPRTLILSELINNMPTTLSLLDLGLESKVVAQPQRAVTMLDKAKEDQKAKNAKAAGAPAEIPTTEVTLTLTGVAPTDVQVAQYMAAIGRVALFKEVNLAYSEEMTLADQDSSTEDPVMRKFRIEMKLNQGIDVQKLEPTMVKRELNKNPMGDTVQIDSKGKLVMPESKRKSAAVLPATAD